MDFANIAMTPANGTSIIRRNRAVAPERVNRAIADMDHMMSAFEVGAPTPAPTAAEMTRTRTLVNEPSWASTLPVPGMR